MVGAKQQIETLARQVADAAAQVEALDVVPALVRPGRVRRHCHALIVFFQDEILRPERKQVSGRWRAAAVHVVGGNATTEVAGDQVDELLGTAGARALDVRALEDGDRKHGLGGKALERRAGNLDALHRSI